MEDAVEGVFFLEEGGEVGAELRGKGGGERGGDLEARWGGGRGVVCYHFGGGSWEVGACGSEFELGGGTREAVCWIHGSNCE